MNSDFPNYVNFYSSFDSPTKQELKAFLEQNGWASRKESWEDFEFINDWSDLILSADENNPLLSGTIKDPNVNYKKLVDIFRTINAKFLTELYDENKVLVYCDKSN